MMTKPSSHRPKELDDHSGIGGLKNGTSLSELQRKATPTTLSIGDVVKINGLVNSSQYSGKTGVIVSAVDAKTNRCGARITGNGTNFYQLANQVIQYEVTAINETNKQAGSIKYNLFHSRQRVKSITIPYCQTYAIRFRFFGQ
jgi:hypothetical protein